MRAQTLRWSWQGHEVEVGVDAAGEGRTVLLFPALSSISTRAEMHPLMRRLAGRANAVAIDWPGFGERSHPAIRWTPDALSSFLDHVLRTIAPAPHAIVAAGHAAAYALHHAAAHPGQVGRLALIAPTWRGPLPTMAGGDRPLFARIRRAIQSPLIGPLLYRLNVNPALVGMMARGHVYSDARAYSGERQDQKRRVIAARNARFGSAAFVTGGLDRVGSCAAFLDLARRAGAPILLVYGSQTPPKSCAEMQALAAVPGVQSVVTPHGKLAVHEEFADEVAPSLERFLFA